MPLTVTLDTALLALALAALGMIWRRIDALGTRVDALGTRVDALAADVRDVDRRVARLEGWIEGERSGRALGRQPDDGAAG